MAKYYTCIIPFVETGATEWHPTDRNFAPLSRGAFQTEEKAHEWAAEKIPGAEYAIKIFPCPDCAKFHAGKCDVKVTYHVHGLDVWGNEKDGFEVNDVYPSRGTIEVCAGASNREIVLALKAAGFIKRGVRHASVEIEGEIGYTLNVNYAPTAHPEYELRPAV